MIIRVIREYIRRLIAKMTKVELLNKAIFLEFANASRVDDKNDQFNKSGIFPRIAAWGGVISYTE